MKKLLPIRLFAGAMLLCGVSLTALAENVSSEAEENYYLQIVETDGGELTIPFSERPEISYRDNALVLVSETMDIEYPDGTLDYFTITTTPAESGVILHEQTERAVFRISGDAVYISNAKPGREITVASTNGIILAIGKADANGEAILSVPSQRGGIYLVNTGSSTFKYIKK